MVLFEFYGMQLVTSCIAGLPLLELRSGQALVFLHTSCFFPLSVLFLVRPRKRTKKNGAARRGAGFSANLISREIVRHCPETPRVSTRRHCWTDQHGKTHRSTTGRSTGEPVKPQTPKLRHRAPVRLNPLEGDRNPHAATGTEFAGGGIFPTPGRPFSLRPFSCTPKKKDQKERRRSERGRFFRESPQQRNRETLP